MNYKLIIFDLDGTLIDSVHGTIAAMNIVFEKYGFPIHSDETYKQLIGFGRRYFIKNALPEDKQHDNTLIDAIHIEMDAVYEHCWEQNMTIFPGVKRMLALLDDENIPYAVNTSRDEVFARKMIDAYLPEFSFKAVIGCDTLETKKPDAAGINFILEKCGVSKTDAVYIGDADVDVQTAENAGVACIAVDWGYRKGEQLVSYGAKRVVSSVDALLEQL